MSFSAFRHYLFYNPRYLYSLIKHKIGMQQRFEWIDKHAGTGKDVPPPLVYKFILTEKCNLTCKRCMNLIHRDIQTHLQTQEEMEFALFERILDQLNGTKPSVILSGGEPMLHSRFSDCIRLLDGKRLSTHICTNGTMLLKHVPLLEKMKHTSLIISLDGIRETNDTIRGNGVYDSVVSGIRNLRKAKNSLYIGIQHTIQPENVATMYRFCKVMMQLKVDWILLNPCWHMTEQDADVYKTFMKNRFGVTPHSQAGYVMKYLLDTDLFEAQYRRIKAEKWPVQISCYYNNPIDDIKKVLTDSTFFCGNQFCYKQWIRMDILPDGKVVTCQQYPDIVVGDLYRESCAEIWNNERLRKFRRIISEEPLPVCNKCAPIYLYDRKRKVL